MLGELKAALGYGVVRCTVPRALTWRFRGDIDQDKAIKVDDLPTRPHSSTFKSLISGEQCAARGVVMPLEIIMSSCRRSKFQ